MRKRSACRSRSPFCIARKRKFCNASKCWSIKCKPKWPICSSRSWTLHCIASIRLIWRTKDWPTCVNRYANSIRFRIVRPHVVFPWAPAMAIWPFMNCDKTNAKWFPPIRIQSQRWHSVRTASFWSAIHVVKIDSRSGKQAPVRFFHIFCHSFHYNGCPQQYYSFFFAPQIVK